MRKKPIVLAVIISALSVALVFGFASFMVGRAHIWSAEHRAVSTPMRMAVNGAYLIKSYRAPVVVLVAVESFIFSWLLGRWFWKHEDVV